MAAVFFKVGALALRTISKPLGDRFQRWVLSHPTARPRVIAMAQKVHTMEVYITRGAEGKTGRAFVGSMTEEKSIEMAAKIASEGFVFSVGVLVVVSEYDRQRRKDILKRKFEKEEKQEILRQAHEENERLRQVLDSFVRRVEWLEQAMQRIEERRRKESGWRIFRSG